MREENLFSIVIPTMWESDYLSQMLPIYNKSKYVGEIILIDNAPNNKREFGNLTKIVYYTETENIFVNPAWNLGFTLSRYNLILANDDIFFDNVDDVLCKVLDNLHYDIIGLNWGKTNELKVEAMTDWVGNGFGCFMYVKNYKSIPYQYKIWRGDYILFERSEHRGMLSNPKLIGDLSKTINSSDELVKIANQDKLNYSEPPSKNKTVLFVIVNYGYEQIGFLDIVVNEIKRFKQWNSKIIVHSDVSLVNENIDEVRLFQDLKDNKLLPLTCRSTILENVNNFDLYVYTENDLHFNEYHLDKYLEYYEMLPKNRISGLIRYEVDDNGENHYPDYFKSFEWDFNSVETYGGKKFVHFTNLHQASFILTNEQLNNILKIHDFTKFFDSTKYDNICQVNTDMYEFCNMKKMICISDLKENLIHHLPNLYIEGKKGRNKNQSSDNYRMMKSINKLLNTVKSNVDISIIIPTYKNTEYIDECINSIMTSSKDKQIEILVGIDGCSETLNHIQKNTYPEFVKFYYFNRNLGPYIIRNTLSRLVSSENILFFDSDDVMGEHMINQIITKLSTHSVIRPKYVNFINGSQPDPRQTYHGEGVFAIKKDLFHSMNGFEPWLTSADTEFSHRLSKRKINVFHTPGILFNRRKHPNSLTNRQDAGMRSKLRNSYAQQIGRKGYDDPSELYISDYEIVTTNIIVQQPIEPKKVIDLSSILTTQPRKIIEQKTVVVESRITQPDISHIVNGNTEKPNIPSESFYSDINPIKTQYNQRQTMIDVKKNQTLYNISKTLKTNKKGNQRY